MVLLWPWGCLWVINTVVVSVVTPVGCTVVAVVLTVVLLFVGGVTTVGYTVGAGGHLSLLHTVGWPWVIL